MQMSKRLRSIAALITTLVLMLYLGVELNAQLLDVSIEVDPAHPARATIRARRRGSRLMKNPRHLAFRPNAFSGESRPDRVSDVKAFDGAGNPTRLKKLADGEYLGDSNVQSWEYAIDLTPPKSHTASAHISWIAADNGLLMLEDLLPLDAAEKGETVRVLAKLGDGWQVFSGAGGSTPSNTFETTDYEQAVIAIGKEWRQRRATAKGSALSVVIHGAWLFGDEEATQMATEIIESYVRLFGLLPARAATIFVTKFPTAAKSGQWEAETRGNTVTIISSDMSFKTQSVQRLHEQLRHELFHLWIPNGLNLTGDYDWFYEGFALYESLKLAVDLNRIRFEDFLDTLSRAHTIDSAQSQRTSLIQSSANRFSGANTQVYARGMLVAFLCDLGSLQESRGRRSVEDILKEVFKRYSDPLRPVDGNTAIINILKENPRLIPIVEKYVTGVEKIQWDADLTTAGLEDSDNSMITSLRVKEKLNGRQKAMLDKLGYNNWRKLSATSK